MTNLKSLTFQELTDLVKRLKWEDYRVKQIFSWIWQKGIADINLMTNLAKPKREQLQKDCYISTLKLSDRKKARDNAEKFLFSLQDNNNIESVFIPESSRKTVCVSTQVGCALDCKICYTGKMGFTRNLKFYEIADQVLQVQLLTNERISNVVFMGMGEPFLNYNECLKAIEIINSDFGLNIGARKITVSTAGIIERIYDFADFPLQAKLAISLNAANAELRNELMPINKKYPLKELIKAVKYYVEKKKKRVTFEYVLIKGLNDQPKDVKALTKLLKGISCKINLIPLNPAPIFKDVSNQSSAQVDTKKTSRNRCGVNPYPKSKFLSPSLEEMQEFADKLYPELPAVTIRKSRGSEILAACGQLVGKASNS